MAINYYRHVRYEGDGVDSYQCLKCYDYFCNLSDKWRWCPLCGTQWLGEWPPEPERKAAEELAEKIYQAHCDRPRSLRRRWVIESRTAFYWRDGDTRTLGEWRPWERRLDHFGVETAKDVVRSLRLMKAEDAEFNLNFREMEYRVRLVYE